MLKTRGYKDLSLYCTESFLQEELYSHDNRNGGVDFYNVIMEVPVKTFGQWESEEGGIEERERIVHAAFDDVLKGDESIFVNKVSICPSSMVGMPVDDKPDMDFSDFRFEVQTKCGVRSDRLNGVRPPSEYPSFVLNHNDDWNDYSCKTWYSLFYFKTEKDSCFLGELKIMNRNDDDTNAVIPKVFNSLDKQFCSLGIDKSYYHRLKNFFEQKVCERILIALQDCAVNIEVYERYKNSGTFNMSLVRELESERALREAKFIINDRSLNDAYNIRYLFTPYYNTEQTVPFRLEFKHQTLPFGRCAGIIGENGVGKTTMMGSLIDTLINRKSENMECDMPLFSSLIAICSTPYDCFADINQNTPENLLMPFYYFCANQNKDDVVKQIIDAVKVIRRRRFKNTGLFELYNETIQEEIAELKSYILWEVDASDLSNPELKVHGEELEKAVSRLSSGQLQLFLLITFIFSKINLDSLLVIDEPEVHLHPRAINKFFKLLANLLKKFQCFCIVSTHSPLIVRELSGEYVYIMRRQDDVLTLGKIGIETLGEDISTLYEEIFGYDEGNTFLAKIIQDKKKNGKNKEAVVRSLSSSTSGLSVNTRMLINRIMCYEENQ